MENISIHTTASVVTKDKEIQAMLDVFQSTPLHQWWLHQIMCIKKYYNFNPHHCISGDMLTLHLILTSVYFNPHHCISGDRQINKRLWSQRDFNPHHCISGDHILHTSIQGCNDFNPHHCISGDRSTTLTGGDISLFQSTPLHQWWPPGPACPVPPGWISIHTTASVVTNHDRGPCPFQPKFQSTPLHQWWLGNDHDFAERIEISIHTTASVVTRHHRTRPG